MTTRIDISTVKRTADLPENDRFFDMHDGETLVAHICFPHRLDPKGTLPRVTFYDERRNIIEHKDTSTPVVAVRMRLRADKKRAANDQSNIALDLTETVTVETVAIDAPVRRTTATEAEVRAERSGAYADGIDMGIAHVLDALASGKSVADAIDFAKAMGKVATENMLTGERNRCVIRERREAIRSGHNVQAGACTHSFYGKKLV